MLKFFRGCFATKGSTFSSVSPDFLCASISSRDPFCNPAVPAGFNLYMASIIFLAID